MNPHIRRAAPADAEAIARIHVDAWRVGYRGQLPDDLLDGLDVDARTARWQVLLDDDTTQVLVGGHDPSSIEGFVAVGPSRDPDMTDHAEVYAIYVAPNAWGTGTGSALLEQATSLLADEGHTAANLWVLDSNQRARRFYEHHGWGHDGTTRTEQRGAITLQEVRYRLVLS